MNKWMVFIFLLCLAGLAAPFMRPHDAIFYFNRGSETLANLDAASKWSLEWDLRSALADFAHAIRLNPQYTGAYSSRARVESLQGNSGAAIRDYTSAIRLAPEAPDNYLERANLEAANHDFDPALADYSKVIELEPDNRAAYRGRMNVRQMQNDLVGVVMERVRMIENTTPAFTNPAATNGGFFMGRGLGRGRGRLMEQLDRAIGSDTNFAWGYYYRGVYKCLSNDWTGALADFQRCQNYPDARLKDDAALQAWVAQAQAGEQEQADKSLQAYCESRIWGKTGDWPMQIARFLLGQSTESDLSKGILPSDTGRQESEFWYYCGMKRLLAGDKTGAEHCFRKSLESKRRSYAVFISAADELRELTPMAAGE